MGNAKSRAQKALLSADPPPGGDGAAEVGGAPCVGDALPTSNNKVLYSARLAPLLD